MTPEEIQNARDICNKATGGAWTWEHDAGFAGRPGTHTVYAGRDNERHGLNLFGRLEVDANGERNLEFICNARDMLPKAISHIEALEAEVARLRQVEKKYLGLKKPREARNGKKPR